MTSNIVPARSVPARLSEGYSAEQLRDQLQKLGREDPEAGHSFTEELMRSALKAIRDGHPNPQRLAAGVLIVEDAEFPRWCA